MKQLFLILGICILIHCQAVAQAYFEGYILYKYEYFSIDGKNISKQMHDLHPSEQHYYINQGNYVAYDQDQNLMQLYNAEGNQYFFKRGDGVYKLDAGDVSYKGSGYSLFEKQQKVLKYACKSVEKEGNLTYYSDLIRVDPMMFSNHNLGDWNAYLSVTGGALGIKSVIFHEDYYVEMTATKIEPKKLDQAQFDIEKILGIN